MEAVLMPCGKQVTCACLSLAIAAVQSHAGVRPGVRPGVGPRASGVGLGVRLWVRGVRVARLEHATTSMTVCVR